MKHVITSLMLFCVLSVLHANAQLPVKVPTGNKGGIGNLLSQFTNAIQPSSFTPAWNGSKGNFLSSLSSVKDAAGAGRSIAQLAGFIKPDLFKQGFNVQNLIQTANTVKTLSSAAGLLKSFEGGLKPAAFTNGWSQKRTGWLNALNLIK